MDTSLGSNSQLTSAHRHSLPRSSSPIHPFFVARSQFRIMRPTQMLRNAGMAPTPFSAAHKAYIQSLYRRYLRNSLNWCIRRDIWRDRAIEIRAEFERNRHIANPRELGRVLQQAEEQLSIHAHPDPYKSELHCGRRCTPAKVWTLTSLLCLSNFLAPMGEDGTKWCVSKILRIPLYRH